MPERNPIQRQKFPMRGDCPASLQAVTDNAKKMGPGQNACHSLEQLAYDECVAPNGTSQAVSKEYTRRL